MTCNSCGVEKDTACPVIIFDLHLWSPYSDYWQIFLNAHCPSCLKELYIDKNLHLELRRVLSEPETCSQCPCYSRCMTMGVR